MLNKAKGLLFTLAAAGFLGMVAGLVMLNVAATFSPESPESRYPSIEDAQAQVPFKMIQPTNLPSGYELQEIVLLESPTEGGLATEANPLRVTGATLIYRNTQAGEVPSPAIIYFEQVLGRKVADFSVIGGTKDRVESVRGFDTDVWEASNIDGDSQILLAWEDSEKGIYYDMLTFLSDKETLLIARSLD